MSKPYLTYHAHINTAPAWFGPAVNQVVNQVVKQALNEEINKAVNQALTPIWQFLYKSYNMHCFDGSQRAFEILPFDDGTLPNAPPVSFVL